MTSPGDWPASARRGVAFSCSCTTGSSSGQEQPGWLYSATLIHFCMFWFMFSTKPWVVGL